MGKAITEAQCKAQEDINLSARSESEQTVLSEDREARGASVGGGEEGLSEVYTEPFNEEEEFEDDDRAVQEGMERREAQGPQGEEGDARYTERSNAEEEAMYSEPSVAEDIMADNYSDDF